MHRSVDQDGVASMQPEPQVKLVAGENIALDHLMLMADRQPIAIGEEVEITLWFKDGQRQAVSSRVVSPATL